MELLNDPPRDAAAARRELEEAGYKGERIVLLEPTDIGNLRALAAVAADALKRIGMNVDVHSMGWNALVQRRFREEPVEQGGWSIFCTFWNGLDQFSLGGRKLRSYSGRLPLICMAWRYDQDQRCNDRPQRPNQANRKSHRIVRCREHAVRISQNDTQVNSDHVKE